MPDCSIGDAVAGQHDWQRQDLSGGRFHTEGLRPQPAQARDARNRDRVCGERRHIDRLILGNERNFKGLLMYFAGGDVGDQLVSQKMVHRPSYRRCGALQRQRRAKINFREISASFDFRLFQHNRLNSDFCYRLLDLTQPRPCSGPQAPRSRDAHTHRLQLVATIFGQDGTPPFADTERRWFDIGARFPGRPSHS